MVMIAAFRLDHASLSARVSPSINWPLYSTFHGDATEQLLPPDTQNACISLCNRACRSFVRRFRLAPCQKRESKGCPSQIHPHSPVHNTIKQETTVNMGMITNMANEAVEQKIYAEGKARKRIAWPQGHSSKSPTSWNLRPFSTHSLRIVASERWLPSTLEV